MTQRTPEVADAAISQGHRIKVTTETGRSLMFAKQADKVVTKAVWCLVGHQPREVTEAIESVRHREDYSVGAGWYTPYLDFGQGIQVGEHLSIVLVPKSLRAGVDLTRVSLEVIADIRINP